MKKVLIAIAILFASKVGMAQTAYTDSTLNTMSKLQLTKIYLDQVTTLAFSTPYTPFTIGVSDTIHGDLDIPVSRYTSKKRDKIMEMSKAYGELMEEQLYELVPYSDKKDIIRAILFLQETNNNIKVTSK